MTKIMKRIGRQLSNDELRAYEDQTPKVYSVKLIELQRDFIRLLADPDGQNMSMRHITVSTCGIIPGIERLEQENLPITLALSLHAATQEKRVRLMPVSGRYPLDQVLAACDRYRETTGRRMTYE